MRRTLAVFAVLFVSVLAGCSDSSTGPNASVSGSYSLRTINGFSLPYVLVDRPGYREELVDETITIQENGTFSQQGSYRYTENGFVSVRAYDDFGTYTRSGTNLTLRFNSDGSRVTGTVENGALIIGLEGVSLVYRR
ncbi:MAG: hypothetical protein JWL60_2584 [Gemmatimonadetes bacterium]|jgi:hypothetical protein|nr:hypothetical protein [Gemmatimonadota bacterium]